MLWWAGNWEKLVSREIFFLTLILSAVSLVSSNFCILKILGASSFNYQLTFLHKMKLNFFLCNNI